MYTWIRVEDEFGQFDVREDQPLPEGVTEVKDYPKHVGPIARDSKAKVAKGGTKTSDSRSGTGKSNQTEAGVAGKESE